MAIAKKPFINTCAVPIGGKQPGERFLLSVEDDGTTPAELYWRKRVAEGAVKIDPPNQEQPADKAKTRVTKTAADKGTA